MARGWTVGRAPAPGPSRNDEQPALPATRAQKARRAIRTESGSCMVWCVGDETGGGAMLAPWAGRRMRYLLRRFTQPRRESRARAGVPMADRVGSFGTVRVAPTRGRSTHVGFALLALGATVLAVLTLLPIWRYEAWWVRGQD